MCSLDYQRPVYTFIALSDNRFHTLITFYTHIVLFSDFVWNLPAVSFSVTPVEFSLI